MTELKPCPFCGGAATLHEIPPHTHSIATFMPDHAGSWTIECGCGAGLIDGSKESVIRRWNTRPKSEAEELLEWLASLPVGSGLLIDDEDVYTVDVNEIDNNWGVSQASPLDALRAAREASDE